MMRISKLLLQIDINIRDHTTDFLYKAIEQHGDVIARVIAVAITNKREEPSQKLVDFIIYNFTSKELFGVLTIVLRQMDVGSFINSIISMKGLSVLESGAKKNGSTEVSP